MLNFIRIFFPRINAKDHENKIKDFMNFLFFAYFRVYSRANSYFQ